MKGVKKIDDLDKKVKKMIKYIDTKVIVLM